MPEILTESFCERCGTRYTFESAAPKAKRLGKFKTLSKGLRNFVLDDDTSLDEALAAARSEEDREATAQQLDAFHKAFNFCMSCRQYTCANCWNEPDGRCLTCAPHLGHDILQAPFPQLDLNGVRGGLTGSPDLGDGPRPDGLAWPTIDRPAAEAEREPQLSSDAWRTIFAATDPAAETAAPAEPGVMNGSELEVAAAGTDQPAATEAVEATAAETIEPVADSVEPISAPRTSHRGAKSSDSPEDRAAAAAAQTAALLARFRPGQSIDAALDAYEASLEEGPTTVDADAVVTAGESIQADAEPVQAEAEPPTVMTTEPDAVDEVEPQTEANAPIAAPEPVAVDQPDTDEPAPEPLAAEWPAATEPVRPADDRVELPTWRIVAPEAAAPTNGAPAHDGALPAAASAGPGAPPWPATPEWPTQPPADAASFLAAHLAARQAADGLWAASSRDVVAPAGAVATGVQSCVSCGLSLSATAKFCRRCGSRQG